MDTSEQYIKMCDCEEVQGPWKPGRGDWMYKHIDHLPKDDPRFYHFDYGTHPILEDGEICAAHHVRMYKDTSVFLPRQDQIQEWMNYCFWDVMLENFIEFYDGGYVSEIGFLSMEQFWLAFYMYEKHGKVWNGEEWAKSDGAKGLGKVSKESHSTVTRER